MLIKSIYAKGSAIAVAVLEKQANGVIRPTKLWESTPDDSDFIPKLNEDYGQEQVIIVSPDDYSTVSEPTSWLKSVLKGTSSGPLKISKPMQVAEGLATLKVLQRENEIDCSRFAQWRRLSAQLKQIQTNQPVTVLAFFQGIVYLEGKRNSRPIFLGGTTRKNSVVFRGYMFQRSGHFRRLK